MARLGLLHNIQIMQRCRVFNQLASTVLFLYFFPIQSYYFSICNVFYFLVVTLELTFVPFSEIEVVLFLTASRMILFLLLIIILMMMMMIMAMCLGELVYSFTYNNYLLSIA